MALTWGRVPWTKRIRRAFFRDWYNYVAPSQLFIDSPCFWDEIDWPAFEMSLGMVANYSSFALIFRLASKAHVATVSIPGEQSGRSLNLPCLIKQARVKWTGPKKEGNLRWPHHSTFLLSPFQA